MKEIEKFRSSKYAYPSNINSVIEEIKIDLLNGEYVLFVGLPCHVKYLKSSVAQLNAEKLLTIDIICGGCTYEEVNAQFVDYLESIYKSAIVSMNVRYKNPEWTPPYIKVDFKNGKCYCKEFYRTEYGSAFEYVKLPSCYSCKVKGDNHYSDITIGDAWGIKQSELGYNHLGVSVAFVHSDFGDTVMSSLSRFVIYNGDSSYFKKNNPRYNYPKEKAEISEKFKDNYLKYGLIIGYKKTFSKFKKIIAKIKHTVNKVRKQIK